MPDDTWRGDGQIMIWIVEEAIRHSITQVVCSTESVLAGFKGLLRSALETYIVPIAYLILWISGNRFVAGTPHSLGRPLQHPRHTPLDRK